MVQQNRFWTTEEGRGCCKKKKWKPTKGYLFCVLLTFYLNDFFKSFTIGIDFAYSAFMVPKKKTKNFILY